MNRGKTPGLIIILKSATRKKRKKKKEGGEEFLKKPPYRFPPNGPFPAIWEGGKGEKGRIAVECFTKAPSGKKSGLFFLLL